MKVYFNNSCKICRAEINLYKKEKVQEIELGKYKSGEIPEKWDGDSTDRIVDVINNFLEE